MLGDWEDVPAAVAVAVPRSELAVLERERVDERTLVFHLIGVRSEEGTLTARRLGDSTEMVEIELEAEISLLREGEREQRLQRDVARRLQQLAGVEVSPLEW